MNEPSLADLWEGRAYFGSEFPGEFAANSVNLNGHNGHSGDGKFSIDKLKDGRFIGISRHTSTPSRTKTIEMRFSQDGLNFSDSKTIIGEGGSGWKGNPGDPSVIVLEIQGEEHIIIVYEADRRTPHQNVVVNTGMMWSSDTGETWKQHGPPLTESQEIPNWGKAIFRGTSVPTIVVGSDRMHVWIYWTGLYESNPNHAEIGAGFIPVVKPGTQDWLSLDDGGTFQQRPDGWFDFVIDPPQKNKPVMERGPFDWCNGAVDIGNVVRGEDGLFYATFIGGRNSEGEDDDVFSCGLGRSTGMTSFEKIPHPILTPHGPGRWNGISYPMLIKIRDSWFLYYVISSRNFDGRGEPSGVPNLRECHARVKLKWR